MGKAVDTVLAFATAGAASAFPTALAAAPGDNLSVRSFDSSKKAYIQSLIYSAGGGQLVRVQSPLMHDNVTGLTFQPGEVPSQFSLPGDLSVEIKPTDTIQASGAIAAAGTITLGIVNYYEDLDGADAKLYNWSDLRGMIRYVKSVQVQLGAIAVGAWTDTLFTATENQLHADEYYAILGYGVDPAVDIVGFKGSATGNLRICGPGPVSTLDISEYFIYMNERTKRPFIPVFNSNDRTAFYVSAANHAAVAAQAASVYPIVAQLTRRP